MNQNQEQMSVKIAGQTLIEVLITIVLVGIGAIALIRFQGYLSYSNSLALERAEATILAVQQLETLRDFQVLNNTNGYTSYQNIVSGTSAVVGTTTTYTIAWTVTAYIAPTYKNMDITISWKDPTNITQSMRLISNVAGIDPQYSSAIM